MVLISEWMHGDQGEDWAGMTLHSPASTFLKDLPWA